MVANRIAVLAALLAVAACGGPDGDHKAAEQRVVDYLQAQRLTAEPLQRVPATGEWGFLDAVLPAAARTTDAAPARFAVVRGHLPAGATACFRSGPLSVVRLQGGDCPGDWLQHRADLRATGMSSYRLGWTAAPRVLAEWALELKQPLDPVRLLSVDDAGVAELLFVQNGDGIDAFAADGSLRWRARELGLGELIDVADLDGDGDPELVYTATARINPRHAAATAAGALIVLSALRGEVRWRHDFNGLEFGPNRYRTTIAAGPGRSRSIFAVMTYSSGVMRFDFDQGVDRGRLVWRSEPLRYDSPDKAPLLVDLDRDGTDEVVVDTLGELYALDAGDGRILASLPYAQEPTFGGFIAAADLDGDGGPEVVTVSNSMYFKGYAVASWRDGGLVLRHRHVWEQGLDANSWELRIAEGLADGAGAAGRPGLLLSIGEPGADDGAHEVQAIDPLTGEARQRWPSARLVGRLREGERHGYALHVPDGAGALAHGDDGWRSLPSVPGARWLQADSAGQSWAPPNAQARPSRRAGDLPALAGVVRTADGRIASAHGLLRAATDSVALPLPATAQPTAHRTARGQALVSDGSSAIEFGADGRARRQVAYTPRMFATPLVADLDGDGVAEIVVPYEGGLARVSARGGQLVARVQLAAASPPPDREAFRVPVIGRRADGSRQVVLLAGGDAGDTALMAVDASGAARWRTALPGGNWEMLIASVDGDGTRGGATRIAFRDSRATALFDGNSGARLWWNDVVGQCQRQLASVDWNGDGVGDLVSQSGEVTWVHDGRSGVPLWSTPMAFSYGSYSAVALAAGRTPIIAQHNIGGLSLSSVAGKILDTVVDQPRIESIPLIVMPGVAAGEDEVLMHVTGSGRLFARGLDGAQMAGGDLGTRVVIATGAFVDTDDVPDLLVSTFDGALVAVSGATLRPLWRVALGGAAGTAVAADVDGDGRGEIVVITGDGRLVLVGM